MKLRMRITAIAFVAACACSAGARADADDFVWVAEWQRAYGDELNASQSPIVWRAMPLDVAGVSELIGLRRDPAGDAFGRATLVLAAPERLDEAASWTVQDETSASVGFVGLYDRSEEGRFAPLHWEPSGLSVTDSVDPDALILTGRLGAIWRFGEGLAEPRDPGEAGSWYIYAGADAQALTWRLGDGAIVAAASDSLRLEDVAMIGDAQAGVAYRLGPGDLTLGFVHREIRHESASADEQFGGVSFVVSH